MTKTTQNILLILGVIVLGVAPFVLYRSDGQTGDGERTELFAGADGQAEQLVTETHPDYTPWFSPFWEPPSGEIESLLFGLQAAIGSGLLFYYIGYHKGKNAGAAK